MKLVLTLSILLLAGGTLSGCCPLSCLIAGSKDSTPSKQVTPTKATKGDKQPAKARGESQE